MVNTNLRDNINQTNYIIQLLWIIPGNHLEIRAGQPSCQRIGKNYATHNNTVPKLTGNNFSRNVPLY